MSYLSMVIAMTLAYLVMVVILCVLMRLNEWLKRRKQEPNVMPPAEYQQDTVRWLQEAFEIIKMEGNRILDNGAEPGSAEAKSIVHLSTLAVSVITSLIEKKRVKGKPDGT